MEVESAWPPSFQSGSSSSTKASSRSQVGTDLPQSDAGIKFSFRDPDLPLFVIGLLKACQSFDQLYSLGRKLWVAVIYRMEAVQKDNVFMSTIHLTRQPQKAALEPIFPVETRISIS
ncbi:hypothetical protein FBUS_11555 [Fasciolopsis buskii]|uniref:Uncharacterized protein n=1 Tax=Fasciolopsis buskii TaxID=27845 RepID=A0A8E0S0T8_9TREM|nr:hypothetical protein FBUS_11555 [Fasciolopsis buski]